MDTQKWKSVALPIDAYEKVKVLAKENERSIARQISFLINQATPTSIVNDGQDTRHHRT
tara:strand:- start:2211 stop:2387 length:177 start_codon:yes stop_codon:yes gene_type:complete